ncbi:MAG: methyl-accepting chemotaxis protein [Anaeromyxobacter sp.]
MWTLARKVVLGLTFVVTGALVMALAGQYGMARLAGSSDRVLAAYADVGIVGDVRARSLGARRFEKDFIINAGRPEAQGKYAEEWRSEVTALRDTLSALDRHASGAERAQLEGALARVETYRTGFERVIARSLGDVARSPGELNQEVAPFKDEIRHVIATAEGIAKERAALAEASTRQAAAERQRTTLALWAAAGIVLAAAALVSLLLARGISREVAGLRAEAARLSEGVKRGELSIRGDPAAVGVDFRGVVEGVNTILDAYERPVALATATLDRLSRGDVPEALGAGLLGEFGRIEAALDRSSAAIRALVEDAGALVRAGAEGNLAVRVDAARHQGDFRRVVQGVNDTLDAVVSPLGVAAKALDELAHGRVPPPIADGFKGDFRRLRDDVNRCIDSVRALVEDAGALARAGSEGRLSHRAEVARHEGEFRTIVEGVNRTLDAVVGPIQLSAQVVNQISHGAIPAPVTEHFNGDFAALKDALNRCIAAVNRLVADADGLSRAAAEGALSTRADAEQHEGDFRRVIEGVNRTLDQVIAPVDAAVSTLEALAGKDLRARVTGTYRGGHARIQRAVNGTAEALHEAMVVVASSVSQVSSASAQIAASSQAVASGASEQAASLQATGDAIARITEGARHATESAGAADALARSAREAATGGAEAVAQMQTAMVEIRRSAEGTSQIIRDVSDIAFQTNLLALNAAVEAARAGEAGRGFAVVAEEVRSLALRAKDAAQKTEALIHESVRHAGQGEERSRQAAASLVEIVAGIGKVGDIVQELSAAAREQVSAFEQVSVSVSEMDKVTQQNAASAEESSSATSELSAQAEELASMVQTFRLERAATNLPEPRRLHRSLVA